MLESIADWFFRNLKSISLVIPLIALLVSALIALIQSLSAATTCDWSGLDDFTLTHPNSTTTYSRYGQHGDWLHLETRYRTRGTRLKLTPSLFWTTLRAYIHVYWRKLVVGIVVAMILVAGVEFAFSRSDNEMKVRTAALSLPPPLCSKSGNQQLLIFIHGWNGDPNDTWKKFPELACADPTLSGMDVVAVNYPTFAKRRNLNIVGLAKWVNDEINRLDRNQQYKVIVVVAHSMGGLIGREIIIHRKLSDQQNIGLLVEIATPHAGANMARMAKALGISEELAEEMMGDSTVLNALTSQWFSLKKNRPTTFCFTSPQDAVVSEQSALAFCDDGTEYPMWGHTEMAKPPGASDARYVSPMTVIYDFLHSISDGNSVTQPRNNS
jgi:pimeloyl-ACP methyl ester carboxylesterase